MEKDIAKQEMDEKVPFVKGYTGILAYYTGNVMENFKKANENVEKNNYREYLNEAARSYVNALEYIIDRKNEYAKSQNPKEKEWDGIKVKEAREMEKLAKNAKAMTREEKDTYDRTLIKYQNGKLRPLREEITEIMMNLGQGNMVTRTSKAVKDMTRFKTMEKLMDYAHEKEKAEVMKTMEKQGIEERPAEKEKKRLVYEEIRETLEKELKNIREKNRQNAEKKKKIDNRKYVERKVSKGMER